MTNVLIATNEPVLARGFEAILTGVHVAEICTDLIHLMDSLRRHRPDVAILDVAVGPLSAAMVELRKQAPRCQFLIWPRQIPPEQVAELKRCGARGTLSADVTPRDLIAIVGMLAAFPTHEPATASLVKQVCNPVERRVISLIGCGMKNHEIAAIMSSDVETVDQQVKILSQRFGVHDRYELALYGLSLTGDAL